MGELIKVLLPLFKQFCDAHVIHYDDTVATETVEHHHKLFQGF